MQLIEYHIKLREASGGGTYTDVVVGVGGMTQAKKVALNRNPGTSIWSAREVWVKK